jgi:hypothetical protein
MVFSSRRNKRGGDKIEDIQSQLDMLQSQVNELKNSGTDSEPVFESVSSMETISEPEPSIVKTWVDDKNLKFKDGDNGRVNLSFNRITTLLDNNIKKGDTGKDWSTIKSKLMDAKSIDGVQDVINQYKMSFSSNYIAGTRRKRRNNKKRTSRKR